MKLEGPDYADHNLNINPYSLVQCNRIYRIYVHVPNPCWFNREIKLNFAQYLYGNLPSHVIGICHFPPSLPFSACKAEENVGNGKAEVKEGNDKEEEKEGNGKEISSYRSNGIFGSYSTLSLYFMSSWTSSVQFFAKFSAISSDQLQFGQTKRSLILLNLHDNFI